MEQHFIQKRLLEKGVVVRTFLALEDIAKNGAGFACVFTGRREELPADAVVLVTARLPNESLVQDLLDRRGEWADAGIESVAAIGDALAPATIAHATYAGRRFAEELDERPPEEGQLPFKREITGLAPL